MELYLMQHGEALPKDVDPERGLSEEGRRTVESAGRALRAMGVELKGIVSSPKKRARQTAQAVAEAVGIPAGEIRILEALEPLVPPEETVQALEAEGLEGPVLVAGHLPSLAELAAFLMDCQRRIAFRMGGVGCLDVERWERGGGTLLWYLPPEHLERMGK